MMLKNISTYNGLYFQKAILEKYLPNYRINLVDAERLEETERFSEDLQVILTMLKYRKDILEGAA